MITANRDLLVGGVEVDPPTIAPFLAAQVIPVFAATEASGVEASVVSDPFEARPF